jgi:hypothetical protein
MGMDQFEGSIDGCKELTDVHEPVSFQVRKGGVGIEEDWIANTSAVLCPGDDDVQKVMELPRCAKMPDDEGDLANSLLEAEIAEVEASVEGTEEGKNVGGIRAETHLGEDDWNVWLLEFVQLLKGEVANG